jgi:GrpB-like predicted nucleotidyltransferase (UPF0157 family)
MEGFSLAEWDPVWAEWYAGEEDRIRAALGARALAIEHVGSTSVPGLAAKPVIDIVLVVADSSDQRQSRSAFLNLLGLTSASSMSAH